MVSDLCDELDYENFIWLVVVLWFNWVDIKQLMQYLFVMIDLEKSYWVNLNMIGLDGWFQVKDLWIILSEWLVFRKDIVICCL